MPVEVSVSLTMRCPGILRDGGAGTRYHVFRHRVLIVVGHAEKHTLSVLAMIVDRKVVYPREAAHSYRSHPFLIPRQEGHHAGASTCRRPCDLITTAHTT